MSKHKSALSDVATLIDERRQYERWLAAIEERRETTPPHVYERVLADYRARLARVAGQLATHKGAVDEELGGLRSRLALIDAEIQLRSDERAEVELRAAVGELTDGDVKKALKAVSETLDTLRVERSDIDAQINQLSEFLAATEGQSVGTGTSSAPPPVRSDDTQLAIPYRPSVPTAPVVSAPSPATAMEPAPASRPAAPSVSEDQLVTDRATAEPSSAPVESGAQSDDHPPSSPGRRSTPFDELGFLSSVVADEPEQPALPVTASGPRLSGVVRDDPPAESILGNANSSSEGPSKEAPLSTNVTANIPIKLRASGQLEPQKTLKCGECGSMNYPTEWYCERCGAELAAL